MMFRISLMVNLKVVITRRVSLQKSIQQILRAGAKGHFHLLEIALSEMNLSNTDYRPLQQEEGAFTNFSGS